MAGVIRSDPFRGASKLAGRSNVRTTEASAATLAADLAGESPAGGIVQLPPRGTSRGSPRRSRTAKAPHINRRAAKLRCACERGGWGRLSDDGPGQHNLDRSE